MTHPRYWRALVAALALFACALAPAASWADNQTPDVPATATVNSASASAAVTLGLYPGRATLGYAISGLTASGATLTVERSNDGGTTWTAVNELLVNGALAATITADGQGRLSAAGSTNMRFRVSSTGTGTVTIATVLANAPGDLAIKAIVGPVTINGASSSASDAVATSATNLSGLSLSYGFNGTTWDRLRVDASKYLYVDVGAALPAGTNAIGYLAAGTSCQSSALAANLVCNAAASTALDFTVTADSTLNAAAWYVMLYNATAAPGDGAVTPVKCYQVPAGQSQFGATFGTGGVAFGTGLTLGVSTTGCFTKTASTHALFIGATYR